MERLRRARQRRRAVRRGDRSRTAARFSATFRRRSCTRADRRALPSREYVEAPLQRCRAMIASAIAGGVLGTLAMARRSSKAASEIGADAHGSGVAARHRRDRQPPQGARDRLCVPLLLGIVFALGVRRVLRDHRPQLLVARRAAWRRFTPSSRRPSSSTSCCRSSTRAWQRPKPPPTRSTLIEPPGFLMLNYGRSTFLVTLVAHIAYGAIVGARSL